MAISYPISLPSDPQPAEIAVSAETAGGVNESPYTLTQEVHEWPGNRWRMAVRYPAMTRADGDKVAAALTSLYGQAGTLLLGPFGASATPKGVATGTPLVNGANQTGKTLATDGWTASVTGILKAGDYLQVGSGATARLHMVLADANSDAGGNATLDIWPRLRESPADNSAIVKSNPKCVCRLARGQAQWDVQLADIFGLDFEAVEAI